jgi:hypothetical protein
MLLLACFKSIYILGNILLGRFFLINPLILRPRRDVYTQSKQLTFVYMKIKGDGIGGMLRVIS